MHLKTLLTALLALALLIPAGASAYTPRHGKPCRHGYVKRFKHMGHGEHRHRVRICVKRRRSAALAPTIAGKTKLHAHLDPSYTRNPLDPFQVTYAYSASATQQQAPSGGASLSAEESTPLPSGVLSLYSDGQLECAVNVGSGVEGSDCPVRYKALGEHRVTTIYTSGEQSATETEVENIGPLGTITTVSLAYEQLGEVNEVASGWYWVGDLHVTAGSEPSAAGAVLGCGEPPTESSGVLTAGGCFLLSGGGGTLVEHVYATGACSSSDIHIQGSPPTSTEPAVNWPKRDDLENGVYHLRAAVGQHGGYSGSEATAPLQFTITWRPEGCP